MPHEFEVREEIAYDASPEEVWQAIATGSGVDSWFMGHSQIEPRAGGRITMRLGGWDSVSTVTAWEPGRRFKHETEPGPDGLSMAFEYLIEGREGGGTVLRLVHSGFLGDNWAAEYDALSVGDRVYLRKLGVYLDRFAPRTAGYAAFTHGPNVPDADRMWNALGAALGLDAAPNDGDRVRLAVDGLAPLEGVVEFAAHNTFVCVTVPTAMYMFVHGFDGTSVFEMHGFDAEADGQAEQAAWDSWLHKALS
jgi:uncharacterized protein YndB with AHSA1/START domain